MPGHVTFRRTRMRRYSLLCMACHRDRLHYLGLRRGLTRILRHPIGHG